MPRDAAGGDQYGVEADVAGAVVRMECKPGFGGGGDARALALGHRPGGVVEPLPRLDLDEYEQMPPPCHDVDLADGAAEAPSEDAETLGDQIGGGTALGGNAE